MRAPSSMRYVPASSVSFPRGTSSDHATSQASHFTANGGTEDYVYGQNGAKSELACSNPSHTVAIYNADNHEYFTENHPAQS